jgi:hypothetical protein
MRPVAPPAEDEAIGKGGEGGAGMFDPGARKRHPPQEMFLQPFAFQRGLAAQPAAEAAPATLYWHPVLVLPGGRAEVTFDLRDAAAGLSVDAYAYTLDGRLGVQARSVPPAPAVPVPAAPRP